MSEANEDEPYYKIGKLKYNIDMLETQISRAQDEIISLQLKVKMQSGQIEDAFLSALQTGFNAGMDYSTNGSKNPANYEHPWEQYKKENNL